MLALTSKHTLTSLSIALALTASPSYAQSEFLSIIDTIHDSGMSSLSRMEVLSASLMGRPYVDGNLGEGQQGQYDRDPLFRFDAFDCTTYVETVLAGTLSERGEDFSHHMQRIRYQEGDVSFVTRNHFTSADWIPNNQWLLQDITAQVGQGFELVASTKIDKRAWYQAMSEERIQGEFADKDKKAQLKALRQEGHAEVNIPVHTPYIPLSAIFLMQPPDAASIAQRKRVAEAIETDALLDSNDRQKAWHQLAIQSRLDDSQLNTRLLERIPSGSIISMVRPNYDATQWIGTHLNVTHQSIAVRKNGRLYLRHASQLKQEVIDESFTAYFSRYLINSSLKGFNIQKPVF